MERFQARRVPEPSATAVRREFLSDTIRKLVQENLKLVQALGQVSVVTNGFSK